MFFGHLQPKAIMLNWGRGQLFLINFTEKILLLKFYVAHLQKPTPSYYQLVAALWSACDNLSCTLNCCNCTVRSETEQQKQLFCVTLVFLFISYLRPYSSRVGYTGDRQKPANETQCPTLTRDS